ncbi:MAG TPA: hypothetical protein VGD45_16800 [Steroidobacter sp.]|uniref:hypothetical protein n=1 Tax=Steroidobacter sp. TaxID=1978227 RepID=UPI002EDAC68B
MRNDPWFRAIRTMGQLTNAVNMQSFAIRANWRHEQTSGKRLFASKSALLRLQGESLRSQSFDIYAAPWCALYGYEFFAVVGCRRSFFAGSDRVATLVHFHHRGTS